MVLAKRQKLLGAATLLTIASLAIFSVRYSFVQHGFEKQDLLGVNEYLGKLHMRKFDSKSYEVRKVDVPYVHSELFSGYAGNKAKEEDVFKSRDKETCEVLVQRGETEINMTSPVDLEDPTVRIDMQRYMENINYPNFAPVVSMEKYFKFSNSAVWLPQENCYLMVTRYMYVIERRNKPEMSICRMQLFDREWKEIVGKRIRYVDTTKEQVEVALQLFLETNDVKSLDTISREYPTFLHVPLPDLGKAQKTVGPEDARIAYRTNANGDGEPIIVYNMLNQAKRRVMFVALPMRKHNHIVELHYKDAHKTEKNWTPFFEEGDGDLTEENPFGFAHFMYDYDDMVILKCNLKTGDCERVSHDDRDKDPQKVDLSKGDTWMRKKAFLRGGTNLVEMPKAFMHRVFGERLEEYKKQKFQLWLGLSKIHNEDCGCGTATYRPNLCVLSKFNGEYRLDLVGRATDLGMNVVSWDSDSPVCDKSGPNVMSANSIASWELTDHKTEDGLEDQMAITLSQGDRTVQMMHLKNVAQYLAEFYRGEGAVPLNTTRRFSRAQFAADCTLHDSIRHCRAYAATHKADKRT